MEPVDDVDTFIAVGGDCATPAGIEPPCRPEEPTVAELLAGRGPSGVPVTVTAAMRSGRARA